MAGFVATQILYVWVQTGALQKLASKPYSAAMLSSVWGFDLERSEILCRAGEAIGLVIERKGSYRLTRKGAVLIGLPGVTSLIEHHKILYRDLLNPVDFFKGGEETQLSKFWPYVFGGGMDLKSSEVEKYSDLMSESQHLVAADTLAAVNIPSVCRFLDVGGGATKEAVSEAFKIILSDTAVKAVLINIFGGIVRCDIIAEGIIGAVKEVGVNVPVVVRFEGNNAAVGVKTLADSDVEIIAATSLTDAVEQVVKAAGGAS
mgnify:CR=1 FL=1